MRLNKGSVIIFPTDTVYGIGAKINDSLALNKIYELKNRPKEKRLAVLCGSLEHIETIAYLSLSAKKLIDRYMPGALTVILKTKEEYQNEFIFETVGVRIPNHPLALEILKENGPMATSSVNISGEIPLNDYNEICALYSEKVDFIYSNSLKPSLVSSTIVDLTTDSCHLIREGDIKFDEIIKFLNN